jgi:hypothetical protein
MKRPIGINVAVVLEILLMVVMVGGSLITLPFYEDIKSQMFPSDISSPKIPGVTNLDTAVRAAHMTFLFVVYANLVMGLLHVVPAYLLWKGHGLARCVATLFAAWDSFALSGIGILISLPIMCVLWGDRKTKTYLGCS